MYVSYNSLYDPLMLLNSTILGREVPNKNERKQMCYFSTIVYNQVLFNFLHSKGELSISIANKTANDIN